MNHVVPPSLLFDFQLSVPTCPAPSKRKTGRLLKLTDESRLFVPSVLNESSIFAEIRVGWNEAGLGFQVTVSGKPDSPLGNSRSLANSDCVLLWIDTRPASNVHRATEYCHCFAALPVDEHADGQPNVIVQPIAQQRNQRQESNPKEFLSRTHMTKVGYTFELWIPGAQLLGFREITELGRIGFHCVVQDSHLGEQCLTVDADFPTGYDPSTWISLDLRP